MWGDYSGLSSRLDLITGILGGGKQDVRGTVGDVMMEKEVGAK